MNQLFKLKGMNPWILGMAVGANFILSVVILVASFLVVPNASQYKDLLQLVTMVFYFIGPFLIGWFAGRMAADLRGASYGLLGAIGGAIPVIPLVVSGGIYGLMLILVALAGGFNGGVLSMRNRVRRKRDNDV